MHRLLLTILIISNASAGIEVATDYEDAWAGSGGPTIAADHPSGLTDGGDNSDEEAACDHCCHGAAHFAGAVASSITLPYIRAASAIIVADTPYYFTSLSPPTPPPNA